ncbi:hypothetical protein [Bifidobacterium longum]|uniref:hypothetical protein n=1 Tax=Bifidobacterium longum TaxID=216816 RepID=UPI0018AC4FE8|nr:hypothetical protein [Bifidobacterium longum]
MDTSDRQIAETGRNRELGLIPAMVMAVVATLSGAGVSFAPLYERIWGGMMLHPNCPAIGRMTYYLSGQATDDYGACVTSPLWFMTVTALSVVAILCLTVAGVQGFSRHRLRSVFSVLIAAVAVAIILVLSANTKIVTLWAMYAVTWLVHAIVTSYLSNGWIRIARLLFVWQIGVMPVFVTEYSVSDEVNFSGGATIACGLGLAAYALVQCASLTIDSQNNSNRITPERSGIRATSLHDLFHTISINASAIRNCSVPVALFWSGITFFTYSYCIGHEALGLLTVVLCVLPLFSLLSAITAITLAARNANNGGNAANADGSRNSAAVCYLLLATALSATAFVIAFTLA